MLNWVEVNQRALANNIRALREVVGAETRIMAVVKANAYGHGLIRAAEIFVQHGADWLAVAMLSEAVQLRKAGIRTPILIMGYIEDDGLYELIDQQITPSIFDMESAKKISEATKRHGRSINVHVKIDTGMHRLGFLPKEVAWALREIDSLAGLKIEAMYSHFANVGDKEYSELQYKTMADILFQMQRENAKIPLIHMANSEATLFFSKAHFDMVRPGRILYGVGPHNGKLLPALSFKTRVASVKDIGTGMTVGYGRTYTASEAMKTAVLAIGYADGFGRYLSNRGMVLIGGRRCPVVGRVCMNQTIVDASNVRDVKPGDEVVIIGEQGKENIGVEEVAERMQTISYEVVSRIPENIRRIYI